ncbi:MAG: VIT1/CCC1 transporter family protein [Anaerolineae bacterium]
MGNDQRVNRARKAFYQRDVDATRQVHQPHLIPEAMEQHGSTGHHYVGDLVFGALSGIVATVAAVSGVSGAALGASVVLLVGTANLLAGGLAAAVGAYVASRSQIEFYEREWAREAWEVEHVPAGERAELLAIYCKQGYDAAEAEQMVTIQTRDPKRWVDAMMVHELQLLRDRRQPLLCGLAELVSFVFAGALPLGAYVVAALAGANPRATLAAFLAMAAVTLFVVGAARVWITEGPWLRSGLEMLLVGGGAAVVAYGVGLLLQGVV